GLASSGNPREVGGRLYNNQWTHVVFGAAGSGASGSSSISTRLRAPAGTPCQASGGDTPGPSQVYFAGIAAPAANAVEVRMKVIGPSFGKPSARVTPSTPQISSIGRADR